MSADVLERPDTVTVTDDGDHDRFTHYYKKTDIERAYLEGQAIVALCGKVDVPLRDPNRYPTCPTCEEKFNALAE